MALSAGTRQAVGMATGWLVLTCAAAISLVYFSEIKSVARIALGAAGDRIARQSPGRAGT